MPMVRMIEEVQNYPIEDRIMFADAILQSINPIRSDVEQKWLDVAKKRRAQFLGGGVIPIPSREVFAEAFAKSRV